MTGGSKSEKSLKKLKIIYNHKEDMLKQKCLNYFILSDFLFRSLSNLRALRDQATNHQTKNILAL